MLHLSNEVIEIELVFLDFCFNPLGFHLIKLLLRLFNHRNNITHAKNPTRHTVWIKLRKGIHFFTFRSKFYRFTHRVFDRQSRTTACVTIQFSQNDTVEIESVVEGFCCVDSVLTCHGVNDKKRFVGRDSVFYFRNLCHHLFINGKTTCRIHDDNITALLFRFNNGVQSDLNRVFVFNFFINRHFHRFSQNSQLVNRCGAIYITSDDHRAFPLLRFQIQC